MGACTFPTLAWQLGLHRNMLNGYFLLTLAAMLIKRLHLPHIKLHQFLSMFEIKLLTDHTLVRRARASQAVHRRLICCDHLRR